MGKKLYPIGPIMIESLANLKKQDNRSSIARYKLFLSINDPFSELLGTCVTCCSVGADSS